MIKPIHKNPPAKNQIGIGDAVAHPSSGQRGIVRLVKGDVVTFESLGKTGPDGKVLLVKFHYSKLLRLATFEKLKEGFLALQKEEAEMLRKSRQPHRRFARWVRSAFASKARPKPQPAG